MNAATSEAKQPATGQISTDGFDAIGFRVGAEEYGLPLRCVQEVIQMPRITRVPKAPAYVRGVINLHGNVVPVVDVAQRFATGETNASDEAKVVVVEDAEEVVGLLAEAVSKVSRFRAADLQPPPPLVAGIAAEYLDGIVRLPGRFVIFLNLAKTLEDDGHHQPGKGSAAGS